MTAEHLARLRRACWGVGIVAIVAWAAGLGAGAADGLRGYLSAYVFWTGLALGCLSLRLMHAAVGGAWGQLIETTTKAAALTIPALALLFLPILFGASSIYPWAGDLFQREPARAFQHVYLNVPFFGGRAALCFALWSAQALLGKPRGGFGLTLWSLAVTVAAIDWTMSLEPHWYSTIYPAMVGLSFMLSAFAFVIVWQALAGTPALELEKPEPDALHDLGNLLFAFLILWAYLQFSQYLIIWSGNLPEEIAWYLHRGRGSWQSYVDGAVLLGGAVPFFLLLSRDLKRRWRSLGGAAALVLAVRPLEAYWFVAPAFDPGARAHWQAAAAWFGLGGLWLGGFMTLLGRRSEARA